MQPETKAPTTEELARLIEEAYVELREIATRLMRNERDSHTLQPTALVNEALLRLLDGKTVESPRSLVALAARKMRHVLIDHGRRVQARRRALKADLLPELRGLSDRPDDLLVMEDCLDRLGQVDERALRVVELRFFGGLTSEQTAAVLEISNSTVEREWQFARTWLARELGNRSSGS